MEGSILRSDNISGSRLEELSSDAGDTGDTGDTGDAGDAGDAFEAISLSTNA